MLLVCFRLLFFFALPLCTNRVQLLLLCTARRDQFWRYVMWNTATQTHEESRIYLFLFALFTWGLVLQSWFDCFGIKSNSKSRLVSVDYISRSNQASVVQRVSSTTNPLDKSLSTVYITGFDSTYPVDRDLSAGKHYPPFEQLGSGGESNITCEASLDHPW